jgi:hypothetical protein
MKKELILLLGFYLLLVLPNSGHTFMTSNNYNLQSMVISGGGSPANSANFDLNSSLGQPSSLKNNGFTPNSDNYELDPGFWYQIFSANIIVYLDLSANWNLISLPVIPDNPNLTYLFPDAEVAYKFDGTYQLVDALEPGNGYWVKLTSGGVYSITGRNYPQCNLTLTSGWHLVGGINATATPTTDPADEIIVMYGFEGTYSEATEFVPGKGYWVKVNNGCEFRVE